MAKQIEIITNEDTRSEVIKRKIQDLGIDIKDVKLTEVYTLDDHLDNLNLSKIASMLSNPIIQKFKIDEPINPKDFDYAVQIGFLPGVTDNVGTTAKEIIEDAISQHFQGQSVYYSQRLFLTGINNEDAIKIGDLFSNSAIQKTIIKSYDEFIKNNGMGIIVPKVNIYEKPEVSLIDIVNLSDEELIQIGKKGISNKDGTRRGPLSMDLLYMKTIQQYYKTIGRKATDIEIESIAQTWSEHCKHTIFADPIDEVKNGLFKDYIKKATEEIRKLKGDKDFCISVFKDNAGGIIFDENFSVCDKVETHNSPSAIDPFGGSITGIVGVNRDVMGYGLGAKPLVNRFGFCFGNPENKSKLYKGKNFTQEMLSARKIMDGVIEGVNVGGNCSGIPTPQGFVYFDESYKGKPLVFVGTVGLIPRKKDNRELHEKKAQPGDYIVMMGGKVGKDGVHGATFSSEEMDSGSPATAVQIGDPITQKKMSDALIKEARDLNLYNSITDNGAGGISCSVAEMAEECGGCYVNLTSP